MQSPYSLAYVFGDFAELREVLSETTLTRHLRISIGIGCHTFFNLRASIRRQGHPSRTVAKQVSSSHTAEVTRRRTQDRK